MAAPTNASHASRVIQYYDTHPINEHEILAKAAAKGGAKLGVAMTFAIAGTIALTAFLVIAIGDAIDNYWLAALIVGALELGIGMVMAKSAMRSMTGSDIKPTETMNSLRENKQWAGNEARDLKREITSANSTANGSR